MDLKEGKIKYNNKDSREVGDHMMFDGGKVAISEEDIAKLSYKLYCTHPELLPSLPSFLRKIQETPNQRSAEPSKEIYKFTEGELAILYIWMLYVSQERTQDVETKEVIPAANASKEKNSGCIRFLQKGVSIAERHLLIKTIIDLMRDQDWPGILEKLFS